MVAAPGTERDFRWKSKLTIEENGKGFSIAGTSWGGHAPCVEN
jgi:hypothetical protein